MYFYLSFADDAQQKGNDCQYDQYMNNAGGAPYKNTQYPANNQNNGKNVKQITHNKRFSTLPVLKKCCHNEVSLRGAEKPLHNTGAYNHINITGTTYACFLNL